MSAIASIIGSVVSGTAQSGQQGNSTTSQGNQSSQVSTNENKPDIKDANVEKAAETEPAKTEETKVEESAPTSSEGKTNWKDIASMAKGLMSSNGGSSAPVTANNISNPQNVANFR